MKYELPKLPYSYGALEPHYSQEMLELHHSKHHQAYVDGLNNALGKLAAAREQGDYSLIKHWEKELAFHGSGHILHTMFWENMSPQGGGQPPEPVAAQLVENFGSVEAFKGQFTKAAAAVEGSGWALLCWHECLRQLLILTAEKHQDLTIWGAQPLLVVDVWEHAYYLQYQNKRGDFLDSWWDIVNWNDVNERFASIKMK